MKWTYLGLYAVNLHKMACNIEPGGNIFLGDSPDILKPILRYVLAWICSRVFAQWDMPDIALQGEEQESSLYGA